MLQSLSSDPRSFGQLSPEGQQAVKRTLEHNGQVIIPTCTAFRYCYAFIPYIPYDGNYTNRPNQGVMVDLKNGCSVREIKGDKEFANWAKDNRDNVLRSFNARQAAARCALANGERSARQYDFRCQGQLSGISQSSFRSIHTRFTDIQLHPCAGAAITN